MRRKIGLLALCFALCTVVVASYFVFSGPREKTFPENNAYDTLTDASRLIVDLPDDFDTLSDPTILRSIIDANEKAIELIDQAATEKSLVRSGAIMTQQDGIDDSDVIRLPMRLMVVKAHLAELESRLSDAVDDYLTIYRIGDASARGGLLVHHGVASVYEVLAAEELARLAPYLDEELTAKVNQAIADPYTPKIENVIVQEKEFLRQEHGRLVGTYMVYGAVGEVQSERVLELMTTYQKNADQAKSLLRERLAQQE